jgi:hypothetical protein
MLSGQDGNNRQDTRDEDFDRKSIVYFRMRLRELGADLRASKSAYETGEIERDEYIGIRKSINQVIREVRATIEQIPQH